MPFVPHSTDRTVEPFCRTAGAGAPRTADAESSLPGSKGRALGTRQAKAEFLYRSVFYESLFRFPA